MSTTQTLTQLLVAEIFGPTFQGEGPSAGQQAMFVRLSRCNLHCPDCDTPFTWDTARYDLTRETRRMPVSDILTAVLAYPPELVVITGGEPLLQHKAVTELATALAAAGRRVEVETNGTMAPPPRLVEAVARFNVSPKLTSFAGLGDRPIRPDALQALAACGKAIFKFVAASVDDLDEVARVTGEHRLAPVWVMPAGTSEQEILEGLRDLAAETLRRGWHLTGRLHVLLWGDQRGC